MFPVQLQDTLVHLKPILPFTLPAISFLCPFIHILPFLPVVLFELLYTQRQHTNCNTFVTNNQQHLYNKLYVVYTGAAGYCIWQDPVIPSQYYLTSPASLWLSASISLVPTVLKMAK